ncbi:ABC transporter permease subunit [Paenibacillus sp. HWE-109]|uniref:ABC transporter permease n=1 Tax=Paenibacillus sp. HWE-109 TaxID=1306526 RepID=UPI001EDE3041|nr:ABC transporter permease subunit [Paenibacillus sp. HWE-109]UKS24751.1 ABC transporter permease subunit [Paenibacillus sp. HWE-109]
MISKANSSSPRRRFQQNIPLLIMFVPVLLYFIIFKYFPIAGNIIAFKNYNLMEGIWGSPWVGLKHFKVLFTQPQTLTIIRNTFTLSLLSIVVGFPFPILIAVLLNELRAIRFKRMVQTLIYLPHFFSWVIIGGIVVTIFSQQSGIVNKLLELWTGHSIAFLYQEHSWLAIFLGSGIWKEAGWGAIIYLAALASIDSHLYEAASIDGASKWRQMWHITLPGIRSTIVLMLILGMGNVMEVGFDHVYTLQNAAVSDISSVISTYIFIVGVQGGQFSLTTAVGLFESLVGFFLVVLSNQLARKFDQGLW